MSKEAIIQRANNRNVIQLNTVQNNTDNNNNNISI